MIRVLGFLGILLLANSAQATIYGQDDFMDVLLTQDERVIEAARAVAIRVTKSDDVLLGLIHTRQLKHRLVCEDERFAQQPIAGVCTAFLIAPDLLMTAGHCITTTEDCQNSAWVFDYLAESETQTGFKSVPQNVFSCKEKIASSYAKRLDYAVIRLDREVTGRQALTLAPQMSVEKGQELVAVTSPQGLPLKFSRGVVLDDKGDNFFATNVDLMKGSSGGPIFDKATMQVVGLVAQGEYDFKMADPNKEFCNRFLKCPETGCEGEDNSRGALGEDVTRISQIPLESLLISKTF